MPRNKSVQRKNIYIDNDTLKKYAAQIEDGQPNAYEEVLDKLKNLWKGLRYEQKNIILNPLAKKWKSFKENSEKIKLWERLSNIQKAELLEFFSRKFTMANAVFAAREFVRNNLDMRKFSEVHIQLEEPLEKNEITGVVMKNTKKKDKLRMMISCSDNTEHMIKYTDKYISEDCKRFIVSHEIAHIILHIDTIVNNDESSTCFFPSSKYRCDKSIKIREYEADCFAKILSDLRDRHILKFHGGRGDIVKSQKNIAESYEEEMKSKNIDPKKIISIIDSVIQLDNLSEKFTMSNSIFATKKIIDIYDFQNVPSNKCSSKEDLEKIAEEKRSLWEKQPIIDINKESNINEVVIEYDSEHRKYKIALPNQNGKDIKQDSENIAKALAVFSLRYNEIKNEKGTISIKKFKKDFEDFPNALVDARKSNVETVLAKIRDGSGDRILLS